MTAKNHQSRWHSSNYVPPTLEQIERERVGLAKMGLGIKDDGEVYIEGPMEQAHNRGEHDLSESQYADRCPTCAWAVGQEA